MKKLFKKAKKGFTIVELVIVIGVIAILSAILIPTFVNLNSKASAAALQSDLSATYSTYVADAADGKAGDPESSTQDLKLYEQNVVAGKTAAEFPEEKVGYVGAFPYAEVKSGYTSWFLGLRQALEDNDVDSSKVTMDVRFTSSWYDPEAEANAATALINDGAVLVSQHADSMGAPGVCEEKGIPNVTYNVETGDECQTTYLAYSRINWAPYYEGIVNAVYAAKTGIADGRIAGNWTGTLGTDSVQYNVNWDNLTDNADRLEGYKAKVATVYNKLFAGDLQVFETSKFTLDADYAEDIGAVLDEDGHVTSYKADVIDDGTFTGETEAIVTNEDDVTYFCESVFRSAPYFDLNIEGINLKN